MFSLANFQVVHLVTSEFFQQGDLERTTLKMEPSVSTEGRKIGETLGMGIGLRQRTGQRGAEKYACARLFALSPYSTPNLT